MSDTPIYDQMMREAAAENADAHTIRADFARMCA
jgi:hypothetical protein